jgi:hypothetical protein
VRQRLDLFERLMHESLAKFRIQISSSTCE